MPSKFENSIMNVTVRVEVVEYLDQKPNVVYVVELDEVEHALDLQDALEALGSIVERNGVLFDGHSLVVRASSTSWGFDASAAEIVLQVAQWFVNEAGSVAFAAAVMESFRRITGARKGVPADPISRDEAEDAACFRVAELWQETAEDLRIVETTESEGGARWLVQLKSTSGATYRAALERLPGSRFILDEIERTVRTEDLPID